MANIAECGMDGIPFGEEKCNTEPCSEDAPAEPVTESPIMIEECTEVEVEEEEPECEEDESKPDEKEEMIEEGSGSGESAPLTIGSGESEGLIPEEGMAETSAEGSGDLEPLSVALFYYIKMYLANDGMLYFAVRSRRNVGRHDGASVGDGSLGNS